MRRLVPIVLALSFLTVASVSLAQEEWLPCNLRSPIGGGGGVLPGTKYSPARGKGDRGYELSLGAFAADYDELDGNDISEISVIRGALGFDATMKTFSVGLSVPHAWVENDAPGSDDPSGLGDVDVHARWALKGTDLQILAGATLPTGDDEESLGFGEPTLRGGIVWVHDTRDRNGKSERGGAAAGERNINAAVPQSRWTIGGGYEHSFLDTDLDFAWFHAGYSDTANGTSRARAIWSVGIEAAAELADDVTVNGMSRDGAFLADVVVAGGALFGHDDEGFQFMFGVRASLTDDGLHDEIVPTLTLIGRWGGKS